MSVTRDQYVSSDNWVVQAIGGTTKYGNGSTQKATVGPVVSGSDPTLFYKGRYLGTLTAARVDALLNGFSSLVSASLKIKVASTECGARGSTQRMFLEVLSDVFATQTTASNCSLYTGSNTSAIWPGPAAVAANRAFLSTSGLSTGDTLTFDITAIMAARLAANDFSRFNFRIIAANSSGSTYEEDNTARTVSLYTSKASGNEPFVEVVGNTSSTSAITMTETIALTDALTIAATTATGAVAFSVDGEFGIAVISQANSAGKAILASVAATNVQVEVPFSLDTLPTGGFAYLEMICRYINASNYYKLMLRFSPSPTMRLSISKVVAGVTSELVGLDDTGVPFVPGSTYHLKCVATGTSPTALKGKLWVDGTAEPDWMVQTTDSQAAMQANGGVGVGLSVGNVTTLPMTWSFDEFSTVTA